MEVKRQEIISIIGVGSPLMGDDGAGVEVVEALERRDLPPGVRVIDGGTGGPGLIGYFDEADVVILVDAADFGAAPGTVRVFAPGEIDLAVEDPGLSLHEIDLAGVLALAKAMGRHLPPYYLVAVQPERVASGFGLSQTIAAALDRVISEVLGLVERLRRG